MSFIPNVLLSKFKEEVEASFRSNGDSLYELPEYEVDIGKALKEGRTKIFGEQVKKRNLEWHKWMREAKVGFDNEEDAQTLEKYFNEHAVKGFEEKSSSPKPIHVFAAHYRLHMYHRSDELEMADNLDIAVFGQTYRSLFGKPVFEYDPDTFRNVQPRAPFSFPDYKTRGFVEDQLRKNKHHGIWLDPHNRYSIPLKGRQKELDRLTSFMNEPGLFRICPVIGPSGSGKTRLVSQWMRPYVPLLVETNWDAGFVVSDRPNARDPGPWKEWEIDRPTLIVIDYTHAFDEVVRQIAHQAQTQTSNHKVRLIVIDHVMPESLKRDFLWGKFEGSRTSGLSSFEQNHISTPIEIQSEKDNSELLKHVIAKSASLGDAEYPNNHKIVLDALEQLDRMGHEQNDLNAVRHPLFAALMGQAIRESNGKIVNFSKWSRRDLIAYYFESDDRLPWKGWDNQEEEASLGLLVGTLVSVATLRKGLDVLDAEKFLPKTHKGIVQKANRIVSYDSEYRVIQFLPDILGEAFLLKFLEQIVDDKKTYSNFIGILTSFTSKNMDIHATNFHETIARLARNLANDDPLNPGVVDSWAALQIFLNPRRCPRNPALRVAISYSIADVMEQIAGVIDRLKAQHDQITFGNRPEEREGHPTLIRRYESVAFQFAQNFNLSEIEKASASKNYIPASRACFQFFNFVEEKFYSKNVDALISTSQLFFKNEQLKRNIAFSKPMTACSFASQYGYNRLIRTLDGLIDEDIDAEILYNSSAMHVAAENGFLETVKLPIELGGNPMGPFNQKNIDTPLMRAIDGGYSEIADYLLQHDTDKQLGLWERWDQIPLVKAIRKGDEGLLKKISNHKIERQITQKLYCCGHKHTKNTVLLNALMAGDQNTALSLLRYKPDQQIAARDESGRTPLILASYLGYNEVVDALLQTNAKYHTDHKDDHGNTALVVAAVNGWERVVVSLLKCSPEKQLLVGDEDGIIPITAVLQECHREFLSEMMPIEAFVYDISDAEKHRFEQKNEILNEEKNTVSRW